MLCMRPAGKLIVCGRSTESSHPSTVSSPTCSRLGVFAPSPYNARGIGPDNKEPLIRNREIIWPHHAANRIPLAGMLALALAALALAAPAQARRLALVVGNDSYQNVQQLKNARADAKAIAAELKAVGFDVTLKQDLTQKMMKAALRDFKAQVAGGDEVVFYFSGHGVQFGGTNYLIPIDITADSEAQVADDAVPLQRILDDLAEQKARFSLAIIDACRSNPFKEAGRAIGGRGLVPVTPAGAARHQPQRRVHTCTHRSHAQTGSAGGNFVEGCAERRRRPRSRRGA